MRRSLLASARPVGRLCQSCDASGSQTAADPPAVPEVFARSTIRTPEIAGCCCAMRPSRRTGTAGACRGRSVADSGTSADKTAAPIERSTAPVIRAGDAVGRRGTHGGGRCASRGDGAELRRSRVPSFEARLKIGGKVVRAVALAPGRAVLERRKRRRSDEARTGSDRAICVAVLLRGDAWRGRAARSTTRRRRRAKSTPPEDALRAYIARVRAQQAAEVSTPGSIWSPRASWFGWAPMSRHSGFTTWFDCGEREPGRVDRRAGEELARIERQLRADLAVWRAQGPNALQNLVGMTAVSGLTAQGQSTTNSSLTTTFGAEVVDVLPNGMLVVQATRQLTFSQQTQLIKLRGLVRPEDVSNQNQVLSTAMTDLELEVTGKGIVNDSTYRQNPLVRLLEKLLVF